MSDAIHWSRWGDPARSTTLPDVARGLLDAAFGQRRPTSAVRESQVRLRQVALAPSVLADFADAVGDAYVDTSVGARLRHTGGKSTTDLLRRRSGDVISAPDAVVRPADHAEVLAVLQVCCTQGIPVVPFGGGTSVVGGLNGPTTKDGRHVAVDLSRLNRLLDVDTESLTATLQAGVSGPEAERLLGAHGLTLGHFPQSFEYASIGGFAATRSSGQASSGYGRFDSMVVGLTVATPRGTWQLGAAPMTAAGPDLRQVVLGSEGAFGVITSVRVAVRRVPQVREYETWRFASFAEGMTAMRTLVQEDLGLTVLRLSDELETALNLATPDDIGAQSGGGVLMLCGYEGTRTRVDRTRREVGELLPGLHARAQGAHDGADWAAGRFDAPYLRDALLDEGMLVETLETACFWSALPALYAAVSAAIETALCTADSSPVVLCHISHVYRSGASLYFTVLAAQDADPVAQWRRAKHAASDAIRDCGATITHHHAVGTDHRPWLASEIGEIGVEVLRAVKDRVDPQGILNPGVLIP